MKNILAYGDNYEILYKLTEDVDIFGNVKLIYIDPPYGTKQDFTFSDDRFASISRINGGKTAYSDTLTGEDYLKFLSCRLIVMRELLSEDGSIYLHIDNKMGHYVKVLMDKIFGEKNFINSISRIKCNPKNFSRRGYGNITDMVLFYSKNTGSCVWNEPRNEFDMTTFEKRFQKVDRYGKRYTTTPLHAPGETLNGETGKEWAGMLPPPGRHWRYPPKVLDELDEKGLIEWSSTGNPRKKIYAEDVRKAGIKMQDVWTFKDPQNPKYPTEKNMQMLKMIIEASSNEYDIVLDAFAGSGSTLEAAQSLNRYFIGIDSSPHAINICKKRVNNFSYLVEKPAKNEPVVSKKH